MLTDDACHDITECCKTVIMLQEAISIRSKNDHYLRFEIKHVARMIINRLLYEHLPLPDINFVGDETGRTWIKLFWKKNDTSLYIYSSAPDPIMTLPSYMNMKLVLRHFDATISSCEFDTSVFEQDSWLTTAFIEIKKILSLPETSTLGATATHDQIQ